MATRRQTFLLAASMALAALRAPAAEQADAGSRRRVAILGEDSAVQRRIVDALKRRMPDLSTLEDPARLDPDAGPAVYAAIGPAALQKVLATTLDGPLISAFTSRQTYRRLLADRSATSGQVVGAVFAEPSPAQQLELIKALFKRRVTVGAMLTDETADLQPLLERAARANGLDLDLQRVDLGAPLSRSLNRFPGVSALLIFPDASLYTPQSLRQLLESTYRRRLPVIGFSAGLVRAGTLASAYSDLDDIAAQLAAVLNAAASGPLPEPQYPRYWRVAINDSVARSLDLVVDDGVRRLGNAPP